MASANWRGTVGVVKPTYESGSLVEFIRLLPEGVGVIPVYAGIKQHTERGYLDALETYHERVAELAKIGVDLMHPEGGPPFMVRGYKSEQEIVGQWEEKYKMPIFTSGMTQTAALRALGIKKFVGCTYFRDNKLNDLFTRYFTDAGIRGASDGRDGHFTRRSGQRDHGTDLPSSQAIIYQTPRRSGHLSSRLRSLACRRRSGSRGGSRRAGRPPCSSAGLVRPKAIARSPTSAGDGSSLGRAALGVY